MVYLVILVYQDLAAYQALAAYLALVASQVGLVIQAYLASPVSAAYLALAV